LSLCLLVKHDTMKTYWEWRYRSNILDLGLDMSGQLHVPSALPMGKKPRSPLDRRVGGTNSRSGCCGEKSFLSRRGSNSGRPVSSLSLHWLSYSGSFDICLVAKFHWSSTRVFASWFAWVTLPIHVAHYIRADEGQSEILISLNGLRDLFFLGKARDFNI
jgi:hypothetical protein